MKKLKHYPGEAVMPGKLAYNPENTPVQSSKIEDRRTPELIIAFVGPVASGVTTFAKIIATHLERNFGYQPFEYKVSSIIKEAAELVGEEVPDGLTGTERIRKYQTVGNKLREKFGENYLAKKCIDQIATNRFENDGYEEQQAPLVPKPKRFVHIIDSLKHPKELEFLRLVYTRQLILIGVFAPIETRRQRLLRDGVKEGTIDTIITIDENEDLQHGQKVRDTIFASDLFVRNDKENIDEITDKATRFLDVLFNVDVNTPTQHEVAMYTALSAGSKSACMSRQVGAAIYSEGGELIGVGCNDVPRFGGGLYNLEDGKNDHRCYKWGGKICHNDKHKADLNQKILMGLKGEKIITGDKSQTEKIISILQKTDIKNLIEYSRSIHAEMEAILSVARNGKSGLVNSTIYSSTYPCHNCARHIVAAGIRKVIYIEPYPKSLAKTLHADAISEIEKDHENHVVFQQFDGIAPKNFMRLFRNNIERKSNGKKIERVKQKSEPLFQSPLDSFTLYEQKVVKELKEAEDSDIV